MFCHCAPVRRSRMSLNASIEIGCRPVGSNRLIGSLAAYVYGDDDARLARHRRQRVRGEELTGRDVIGPGAAARRCRRWRRRSTDASRRRGRGSHPTRRRARTAATAHVAVCTDRAERAGIDGDDCLAVDRRRARRAGVRSQPIVNSPARRSASVASTCRSGAAMPSTTIASRCDRPTRSRRRRHRATAPDGRGRRSRRSSCRRRRSSSTS